MKIFPAICLVLYLLEAPIVECSTLWTGNTADASGVALAVARHLLQSAIYGSMQLGMLAAIARIIAAIAK